MTQFGGVAGRIIVVYFFTLTVIRILGKREIGDITAFDFLVALMVGESVDEIIFGDVPLVLGCFAIGLIGALHYLNSWASARWNRIDKLTGASPTVLIRNGIIDRTALKKEHLSRSELQSALRLNGIEKLAGVKKATLEPSGEISIIKSQDISQR